MEIDLNADVGEGAAFDAELMPLISSANICCGLHAGDPDTLRRTLLLAQHHGVSVGAHPGYADRANFGRVDVPLEAIAVHSLLTYQLGALLALAEHCLTAVSVRYLKPHGALYNTACRDRVLADAIAATAARFALPVVGLPDSQLEAACVGVVPFVREGFADRRYRPGGTLVPRTEPDAFIHDPAEAVLQVEELIARQRVRTICVHGDNPHAVEFARALRAALHQRAHIVKAFA